MIETNATVADLAVGDTFRLSAAAAVWLWQVRAVYPVLGGHRLLHVRSVYSGRESTIDWPANRAVQITQRGGEVYRP